MHATLPHIPHTVHHITSPSITQFPMHSPGRILSRGGSLSTRSCLLITVSSGRSTVCATGRSSPRWPPCVCQMPSRPTGSIGAGQVTSPPAMTNLLPRSKLRVLQTPLSLLQIPSCNPYRASRRYDTYLVRHAYYFPLRHPLPCACIDQVVKAPSFLPLTLDQHEVRIANIKGMILRLQAQNKQVCDTRHVLATTVCAAISVIHLAYAGCSRRPRRSRGTGYGDGGCKGK
jgi:hypothetical protein